MSPRRWPKRITPPGRALISQEKTSAPWGPNQWVKCSAFVHASKTSSRGALKVRVTTSPPAVVSTVSLCAAIALLLCGGLSESCLQLPQVRVEAMESLLPEASVLGRPLGDLAQGPCFQLARAPLGLTSARDEACMFEYAQMLRDGWAADRERRRELRHGRGSLAEPREDRSPRRVRECREGRAQTVMSRSHIADWLFNQMVI